MNATRIAAVVTTLWVASATSALAQPSGAPAMPLVSSGASQIQRTVDPLDVLGRALSTLSGVAVRIAVPRVGSASGRVGGDRDAVYRQQYERYLADYARYQQQVRAQAATPGWVQAMQGINASLQLADRAVGVYEHAVEAKALNAYYSR